MERCPVCGQSDKSDLRGLAAAFLLAAILFFIGGQLFSYYVTPTPFYKDRLNRTEELNKELKKGYNPPSLKTPTK